MKKIMLILMIFIMSTMSVNAILVPYEYQVSIDFQGENDFRLILPNGYERHFFWNNGTQHADTTFSHTVYNDLDENVWCNTDQKITQYENITSVMTRMLDKCVDIAGTVNKSSKMSSDIAAAINDRAEYERLLFICEDRRKTAENKSKDCCIDAETYEQDYNSCNTQKNLYQGKASNYDTAKKDLEKCEASKDNGRLIYGLLGFGAAYWIWGRKKKKGGRPSEQSEMGVSSDEIKPRSYIEDGPKE